MSSRPVRLRIAGIHAEQLQLHLFPGDGKEAVAFALCGRHRGSDFDVLLVQAIVPVPYADCPVRERDQVTWRTEAIEPLLLHASQETSKLAVVKFHSHPGYDAFSRADDISDHDLFRQSTGGSTTMGRTPASSCCRTATCSGAVSIARTASRRSNKSSS